MTKEEYNNYIEALKERGYTFVGGRYEERCYYYKVIEYRKDKYGDKRAVCQLLFHQYEAEDIHYYSLEPTVLISRDDDERLDFKISCPQRSIEECERIAKEFMRWVDVYIDIEDLVNYDNRTV